jgi:PAS domain-containing protein
MTRATIARVDKTEQQPPTEYARSLIEASLDPLVTISPEGKITDVNEATAKVTGAARDKLIGTDFSDYFTEPIKPLSSKKLTRNSKPFPTPSPTTCVPPCAPSTASRALCSRNTPRR